MSQQTKQEAHHTSPPSNKYSTEYNQAIGKLKQLHSDINSKFVKLGEMKRQFFHIQQKKFVKTFLSIMDRLSSEVVEATKATETIDQEINSDPHCLYLQKQLDYFQLHKHNADQEIKMLKEQVMQQFRRNTAISQQRQILHNQLYKQTARQFKYNTKAKVITSKRQSPHHTTSINTRPQTVTLRQKSSPAQSMGNRNLSFQQKMSSNKTRQIPTAMTQKQSTRPYIKSCRLQ